MFYDVKKIENWDSASMSAAFCIRFLVIDRHVVGILVDKKTFDIVSILALVVLQVGIANGSALYQITAV